MKNEYQVRNPPGCVLESDLANTIDREDLVNMLGFCATVDGDSTWNGSGRRSPGFEWFGDKSRTKHIRQAELLGSGQPSDLMVHTRQAVVQLQEWRGSQPLSESPLSEMTTNFFM
jgi:hypothetical protein